MFKLAKNLVEKLKSKLTKKKRNRKWLLFTLFLRKGAGTLAVFFLPLFIYRLSKNGFVFVNSLYTPLQKAMVLIAAYFLLERLVSALFSINSAKIVRLFGHKRVMLWGNVVYILFLLNLFYADKHPLLIFVAAFLSGLNNVLFWQSYNTLVSYNSPAISMGRNLGLIRFARNMVSMLIPALGGVIIALFGFNYVFLVSILIILISLITISHLDVTPERDEVNLEEYLSWLKEKQFDRLLLSQAGRYFYDMSLVLWPLYVFLLIGDIQTVGYLYSLSLFIAMIVNLFTGNFLDKRGKSKLPFFISGGLMTFFWLVRVGLQTAWTVMMVDSLDKIVSNFHWLFFDGIIFNRSKGSQVYSYFVYRMINRSIAAVFFWLILLTFFLVVPIGWTGLFVLGAVGILLSLLAQEKIGRS